MGTQSHAYFPFISHIPYYLEISLHLEILLPSKCRRIHLPTRPNNAALEISPHGKGSTAIFICAWAFYVHTTRLIIEAVYMRVR